MKAVKLLIYLDNAATTGRKPENVKNAVLNAIKNYSANPGRSGHAVSQKTATAVYSVREKIADAYSCDSENVVFTANCTQALNMVVKGVLSKGDHIIISSYEHNASARPVYKMFSDGIVEYDIASVIVGDSEATLRSFKNLIKNNTKLIVCTHASNVTGEIMPINEIAALCKEKGILFCVDAAQTAGVIPIDTKNIDFLCIAPHKGLYAITGTGVLIAKSEIKYTILEGGTGSFSKSLQQPLIMPEMLESGTVNVPGIFSIGAGIDFIKNQGRENVYVHELKLVQNLYKKLSNINDVSLYTDYPEYKKFVPVLSFNIKGYNSMEIADFLSKKGIAVRAGLHCSPLAHKTIGTIDIGTVRVCPSIFNNFAEIDYLCDVIGKKLIKNRQKTIDNI